MKLTRIIIISIIFFSACSSSEKHSTNPSEKSTIDSFESALPHGKMLEGTELSDSDKIKLSKANGKVAETLPFDSLIYQINYDTSGLVIYNFWNLDCSDCKTTIENLKKLNHQDSFEEGAIKIKHINTENLYPEMVNSFIREHEIIDQVFTISSDTIPNWSSHFHNNWNGQLPALLIVNNNDGTRLFYQRAFSFEELLTLLLPLTL